jgi:glycosyltransferase involved in cell wall biosynthesis
MYCPINNRNALILAHKIMKVVNMPVISHVYDDWISFLDKREGRGIARLVGRLIRKRTEARLRKILTMSKLRMTIGDEMSKQYSSRYNLDFLTFQNAPDPEVWLTNGKKDWSRKNPFIIRFTGTAYDKGNLQALVSFAEAVEATTNQGLPILLEIYTTKDAIEKFASLFDKFTKTVLLQTVSESVQMAKLYGSADALLIAYNFEDNSIKWLGMSMPTKLPTYLLSGTPTIVYAPQKTAVTSFFRESGCGYVISSRCNSTDLSRMILDFIENEEMRKQFGLRSREIAINKFSARVIRPMFHDALIKTAIR